MNMCGNVGNADLRGDHVPFKTQNQNDFVQGASIHSVYLVLFRLAHPPIPGIDLGYVYGYNFPLLMTLYGVRRDLAWG